LRNKERKTNRGLALKKSRRTTLRQTSVEALQMVNYIKVLC